ncbi:hypothetical protein ACJO3T_10145 [Marinobacter sp. LN3S78]
MRVLVITLQSGENELEECKQSVVNAAENFSGSVEHIILSGVNRFEADSAVFRKIMENRFQFTHFIKLDADMKVSAYFFLKLQEYFSSKNYLSHLVIPVYDALSRTYIIGMHVFTDKVKWNDLDGKSKIYVDPDPELTQGKKVIERLYFREDIDHCFDPSDSQAFYYGLHRGLKFFSDEGGIRKLPGRFLQFDLLNNVRKALVRNDELFLQRRLFILGFYAAKKANETDLLSTLDNKHQFSTADQLTNKDLEEFLADRRFWATGHLVSSLFMCIRWILSKKI